MINTYIPKYFIDNFRKYKAYIKNIKNMSIYISKANVIYI